LASFYNINVTGFKEFHKKNLFITRLCINLSMSDNSLRKTVHTHRASVRQAAKLVAALLRVARVNAGLAESNGSLQPGL